MGICKALFLNDLRNVVVSWRDYSSANLTPRNGPGYKVSTGKATKMSRTGWGLLTLIATQKSI